MLALICINNYLEECQRVTRAKCVKTMNTKINPKGKFFFKS